MHAALIRKGRFTAGWVVEGVYLPAPSGTCWPSPKVYKLWLSMPTFDQNEFAALPSSQALAVHPTVSDH